METLIKNLKFSNEKIMVLKDKYSRIWFNGSGVCKILNYKNHKDAIKKLVNKKYIKQLKDIYDDYKIYPNAQPNSIFLNEHGLYMLLIRSKKPNAEQFFIWVIEKVLPSIRRNGMYMADNNTKKEIDELNKIIEQKDVELKEKSLQILTLENNQSSKHICSKGKYIYVLKSFLNDYIDEDAPDILKIGKTKKYKIRLSTYNTGQKDNTIVLYRVKTNDISAIENCLKGLLSKKVYRSYKEYYNITLNEAIITIKKCIKLTGSKLLSEDKFYHKFQLSKSSRLNGFNYGLSTTDCSTDQKGGKYYDSNLNEFEIKSYSYYKGIHDEFLKLIQKL